MIFNTRQEPSPLDPDDAGIADHAPAGNAKDDARRGSQALLKALRLMERKSAGPRPKRTYCRYGSWEDRKLAHLQVARLQRVVADHFGIPVETMTGKRGPQEIAEKRQVAMYLAREVIRCSFPDIGLCFGGRDHSTVIHACNLVERNPELASLAKFLRERIAV